MENESKKNFSLLYAVVSTVFLVIAKLIFWMRITGKENIPKGKPVILMGNHQSAMDPLTLTLCCRDRQIYFMGKKELFENKFMGWAYRNMHAFPVDRGNMDMSAIRTSLNVVKEGNTLGIFPEGTRSKTGYMGPLLGGTALLALKLDCDIIPVYIDGRYKPFHSMHVTVGEPIEIQDLRSGRVNKQTCEVLTHRMEDAFAHLSGGKSLPPAEMMQENGEK